MKIDVRIKRAYEPPARGDHCRVLVDRVWPRGVSKDTLKADLWLKDIAPTTELRKWFGHDVARWDEFQRRYRKELDAAEAPLETLRERLRQGRVTLLYGAKDEAHNQAVVLRDYLLERESGSD